MKTFELTQVVEYADIDQIIKESSEKELLNSDFSDEYNNIMRDHILIIELWKKVKELQRQVKRLEENR